MSKPDSRCEQISLVSPVRRQASRAARLGRLASSALAAFVLVAGAGGIATGQGNLALHSGVRAEIALDGDKRSRPTSNSPGAPRPTTRFRAYSQKAHAWRADRAGPVTEERQQRGG